MFLVMLIFAGGMLPDDSIVVGEYRDRPECQKHVEYMREQAVPNKDFRVEFICLEESHD
jgi:hypothetical protein